MFFKYNRGMPKQRELTGNRQACHAAANYGNSEWSGFEQRREDHRFLPPHEFFSRPLRETDRNRIAQPLPSVAALRGRHYRVD